MTADASTAELLPFPSRPEDRLRRALRKLETALTEQGVAIAGFRADLSALSTAVVGLDRSMTDYRGKLGEAATAAGRAQEEARKLEARAEAMLARK